MQREDRVLPRGLLSGFVGATTLAAWFLVLDSLAGEPFHTPAVMAQTFLGQGALEGVGLVHVGLFTLLHYCVFLTMGVLAAWILTKLPAVPPLLLGSIVGFLLFDLVFYAAVLSAGPEVLTDLGWPRVLGGNLLAGLGLATTLYFMEERRGLTWVYALGRHPILVEGLQAGIFGGALVAVWFFALDTFRGQPFLTPAALGS